MHKLELRQEIAYGLENLERVYSNIAITMQATVDQRIKLAALAYDCSGYYNAVEHLMIRIIKYLRYSAPSGPASHKETIKLFRQIAPPLTNSDSPFDVIERLMAFRHVATKIYSFLLDWNKLQSILDDIM
ncbi:MAG: hypothetical protein NZQ09_01380 [Chloroflexus sp.]|nr:hypothetical protein [Chloroflexus sp.]